MISRKLQRNGISNVAPQPPVTQTRIFRVIDYGATADGVTDCREVIQNTLNAANAAGGGVVLFPDGPVMIALNGGDGDGLWVHENLVLRGSGPKSEILVTSNNTNFHPVFNLGGDSIHIESLMLTRANDFYGLMFNVSSRSHVWLCDVTLNGNKTTHPVQTFHGMMFTGNPGASMSDFNLVRCRFIECDYALLESETTSITITGVRVDSCKFWRNRATDLEFNSPAGTCTDVIVTHCEFRDNLASDPAAGFGVGLANIQRVEISWCSFQNYPINPVHLENASANVEISHCWFESFSTSTKVTSFPAAIVLFGGL